MDALAFTRLTQELGDIARSHRLDVPSFIGRTTGPQRVITRTAQGCVVKVRRDRAHSEVAEDLIAGILKTNGLTSDHPVAVEMLAGAARARLEGAR